MYPSSFTVIEQLTPQVIVGQLNPKTNIADYRRVVGFFASFSSENYFTKGDCEIGKKKEKTDFNSTYQFQ